MTDERNHCGRLISLAVHEFRTPTAVVSGYLRMVLRHFGDSLTDQQRKLLEEGEKSCGALARLLADFSDLSQLEQGATRFGRERIPLAAFLLEVASNVQEGTDRGLSLAVEGPPDHVAIEGDRRRLGDAIASLMAAVLRERQQGARLVALSRLDTGDAAPMVVVTFGDAESAADLAAEPGARTQPFDEYRGGLGFRLPVAARVIEAHGGRLASPVAERGRFSIVLTLPVSISHAESAG
jgi:signal transduction histidine kinase